MQTARWIAAAFGGLWTILAIAITSAAPNEFPFIVAKFVFPLFGVLFIIAALTGGAAIQRLGRKSPFNSAGPRIDDRQALDQSDGGRHFEPKPINACPSCGAPVKDGGDVSPSGDIRCPHCSRWYNIHATG